MAEPKSSRRFWAGEGRGARQSSAHPRGWHKQHSWIHRGSPPLHPPGARTIPGGIASSPRQRGRGMQLPPPGQGHPRRGVWGTGQGSPKSPHAVCHTQGRPFNCPLTGHGLGGGEGAAGAL